MSNRNKIAQSMSAEQLVEFIAKCAKTPKLTLSKLQAMAKEIGIDVSLMGAKSFRDTTFAAHMDRLRKAQETALQMQELTAGGATINDAAASLLSQQVFDLIAEDGLDADSASKIVKRLRDSDTRVRSLQHMVEKYQFDATEAAIKHAKEIHTITSDRSIDEPEKIQRVRQRLFGTAPADFKPFLQR
jgi:hypothetical protein